MFLGHCPGKNHQILVTGNATRKQRWRISGNPSFSLAGVTNGGQAQREREASHVLHRHARAGCLDEYMAASWYKRRHRYVDNQRVKLKIVLPTTAMAKLAIDSASLDCLFNLEINREIFIPSREIFNITQKIGRSPAKSGGLEAL